MRTFWPEGIWPLGYRYEMEDRAAREGEADYRQWPAEAQEVLRRLHDFCPWSCERCCQIACEQAVMLRMSLLLPGSWREEEWSRAAKDLFHHLTEERHVLALLPHSPCR